MPIQYASERKFGYLADYRRTLGGQRYDDVIASLDPFLWWKLDEPSGTSAIDSSGNGRNGTYTNSPTLNQSPIINASLASRAVLFSANSYAISAGIGNNPNNFTMVVGVKTTQASQSGIAYVSDGFNGSFDTCNLRMTSDGKARARVFAGGEFAVTSPQSINDGLPHIVVARKNGSTLSLKVDGGAFTNTTGLGNNYNIVSSRWILGHDKGIGYWNATLDEFSVWYSALSDEEIAAIVNASRLG